MYIDIQTHVYWYAAHFYIKLNEKHSECKSDIPEYCEW